MGSIGVRLYAVGEKFPPLDVLPSLCKALGVEPIYILFGIEADMPEIVRIGVSPAEMELLQLFRALNREQQEEVIKFVQFRVATSPLPTNVQSIR